MIDFMRSHPLLRFVIIEAILFAILGLLAVLLKTSFDGILFIVGAFLITLPFMGSFSTGSPARYGIWSDAAVRAETSHNTERVQKRNALVLLPPITLYGLPLLLVSLAITFL